MHGLIYLIGFMGCGKTTLGRALAARTGVAFVDLDEAVEQAAGMSVAEIFDSLGEDHFRRLEAETLRSLTPPQGEAMIVACGGGTPCRAGAMEHMLAHGRVVWLKASPERTLQRLLDARDQRPLLRGMSAETLAAYIAEAEAARHRHYSRANIIFDSSNLDTAEGIDQSVSQFLSII